MSVRGPFRAFISVDDEGAVKALRQMGISINASLEGFVIATIPADALMAVGSVAGVRQVALACPLHLCNDSARIYSDVMPLHESQGLVAPLSGEGVIVGVIDTGIDFNHINFRDQEGRSRVRAVYMPMDSTGVAPVVRGDTLPGSCYETPEQIACLTTDNENSSHGTHTTGTAAGACRANSWYGVAPGADIVACGIPSDELTDVNVAASLVYIFDYADRVGKPCVINMSLGNNGGPNDGTSFMCRTFDALTGPGRICVVSAGNDGNAPICLHGTFGGVSDTLTTLLRNPAGGLERQGYVSVWSDGPQHHRTRLVVINRSSGALEYASPFIGLLPEDSVFTVSSDIDPGFAQYYDGEVLFANALEPAYDSSGNLNEQGRFHSLWSLDATSVMAGHLLGLQYVADEAVEISGWTTKSCYFYTFGLDGMTGGSNVGSISDLATTDSVISVGAYCSRLSYVDRMGTTRYFNGTLADIADFSSFGPDEQGITRPDLCAPGMALISSASRYNTSANTARWPASVVVDGEEYPYYPNQGTSMSAPVVTGTVALMLQVNGSLGPSDVRECLVRSALTDDCVSNGNPEKWGAGKLDAAAAVKDVIARTLLPGDVNNDHEINIADVMALLDVILSGNDRFDASTLLRADVDHDCEILVADINCVIDLIIKNKRL